MKVPFLNLGEEYKSIKDEIDDAYKKVMNSGWYILGGEVGQFEREFAQYCDVNFCIGTGNGLDAIQLLLRSFEIGYGDEVIVPAHTFIATWLAVTNVGACPVPIDINEETYNIDVDLVEGAITEKTKAIIVVHLYGQPAEMNEITKIAARYKLRVIEDAAQAHGASYGGKRVGGLADAAAFSFYPVKNLGAFGDGGAITTNESGTSEKARMMANYGSSTKYEHELLGVNSRLDELQAAFLRIKLKKMEKWNQSRREIAKAYKNGITNRNVILPKSEKEAGPVWHLFVIRHRRRDQLQDYLRKKEVQTLIHYPIPPHMSKAYGEMMKHRKFPVTEAISKEILSLPMSPFLKVNELDFITDQINKFG